MVDDSASVIHFDALDLRDVDQVQEQFDGARTGLNNSTTVRA